MWICPSCHAPIFLAKEKFPSRLRCACGRMGKWDEGAPDVESIVPASPRRFRRIAIGGVGSELKALFVELGLPPGGCGCEDEARLMDHWGIAKCRADRDRLVGWWRASHGPRLAERREALNVLAQKISLDPADPVPGLIDEAIRRSEWKERSANAPVWISTTQLASDAILLASRLPHDAAGIVGIARSGMLPASLIAAHLHLPLWTLKHDGIFPMGGGPRIADRQETDGPLIVIDDNQVTGRSIGLAHEIVNRHLPGRRVLFAVLYRSERAAPPRPDFVMRDIGTPILMEWNFWNSIYTPSLACDFEGILARDCTSEPLYLPRRVELPLVIADWPECCRAGAVDWLARHGVRVRRLEMFPGESRRRGEETDSPAGKVLRVSQWKAEIFRASGCRFFAESDPRQAREIAQLAGKPVVCPAANQVF